MNFHHSIYKIIEKYKTYRDVKKFLKSFGVSKKYQDCIVRESKKRGKEYK